MVRSSLLDWLKLHPIDWASSDKFYWKKILNAVKEGTYVVRSVDHQKPDTSELVSFLDSVRKYPNKSFGLNIEAGLPCPRLSASGDCTCASDRVVDPVYWIKLYRSYVRSERAYEAACGDRHANK